MRDIDILTPRLRPRRNPGPAPLQKPFRTTQDRPGFNILWKTRKQPKSGAHLPDSQPQPKGHKQFPENPRRLLQTRIRPDFGQIIKIQIREVRKRDPPVCTGISKLGSGRRWSFDPK